MKTDIAVILDNLYQYRNLIKAYWNLLGSVAKAVLFFKEMSKDSVIPLKLYLSKAVQRPLKQL